MIASQAPSKSGGASPGSPSLPSPLLDASWPAASSLLAAEDPAAAAATKAPAPPPLRQPGRPGPIWLITGLRGQQKQLGGGGGGASSPTKARRAQGEHSRRRGKLDWSEQMGRRSSQCQPRSASATLSASRSRLRWPLPA